LGPALTPNRRFSFAYDIRLDLAQVTPAGLASQRWIMACCCWPFGWKMPVVLPLHGWQAAGLQPGSSTGGRMQLSGWFQARAYGLLRFDRRR